ncbi:hypothetical protein [Pseudorhodoferax sp. Leaf265]|uniref:hypothetical protein n=1 Tax=Pseudorhodoferax sp. Leaf265 TaxID=1736315 RepID=UPI0012E83E15|nr:hypothetical protein [Pseudorhodoferax sp. Leaf265]
MQRFAVLIAGALAAQALSPAALAQEQGPALAPPPAYQKASPEDKAAGKAQRRQEGRAAVKAGSITGEGTPPPAAQAKVPREQRQQARAQRKAETARAARAGELQASGEVGPSK